VPLGLDFHIGLPREIPDERLAKMVMLSTAGAIRALPRAPRVFLRRVLWPWSLLRKSMLFADVDWNDRRCLELEVPAGNGVGTARAMARAYSAFAEGGAELGITPEVLAQITATAAAPTRDEIMGLPASYSLGFMRWPVDMGLGIGARAFGTPGAGGSFAFADPDARLGYAYVMNKTDYYLFDDPREKALRAAVYRAIAQLG
jgi:CubicO group peptidase (beta-lactamase class C family)